MTSVANLQPDPAPVRACTISRDVQNFEILIDDMEQELGESWGDLSFEDAVLFLQQPEAATLEFVAVAVDAQDEADLSRISDIIRTAKGRNIKVVLIEAGPRVLPALPERLSRSTERLLRKLGKQVRSLLRGHRAGRQPPGNPGAYGLGRDSDHGRAGSGILTLTLYLSGLSHAAPRAYEVAGF